jgi:predicted CXXCH cytochrome family protein
MGHSMAEVDVSREPPDASFDHPLSKRRYQVRRQDGRLWHRELLLADGPGEVVLAEYPVRFVLGSGHHGRTYLVEEDGFLMESPLTWYASRQAWGMSPGYEDPRQPGFQRWVGEACLFCHAGRAEALDGSLHRMKVPEPAIGCERCHGPGSLHVELHTERQRRGAGPLGETDLTIVNPAHLTRELAEAVCQQCHLKPAAVVPARGRRASDFRPGLPLQEFQQPYLLEAGLTSMTVIGHVEQMHASHCYQGSKTFSCSTCHNPHEEPAPGARVAHYKAVCLECHPPERCTVDAGRRQKESPDNNCVQCHMPRSDTDIPHVAFTHHRVAVHGRRPGAAAPSPAAGAELRPFLDLSRWGEVDRQRSLGLGYAELAEHEKEPLQARRHLERARKVLSGVREAGLRDAAVEAALAALNANLGRRDVRPYVDSALQHPDLAGRDRCNVLILLAKSQRSRGLNNEAIETARQLTRLRRHPLDWLLIADAERALGNEPGEIEALANAVRINPRLEDIHRRLADYYGRHGDPERAAWHRQRGVP